MNAQAQQTASTPFHTYGGEFVAPVNSTEQSGIGTIAANQNTAQPYYQAATQTQLGAQAATQPYFAQAGQGIDQAAGLGAGYNAAATGLAAASAGAVNPEALNVGAYESPYIQNVAQSEEALLNQQNQQQMMGELGNVINSGGLGGDRAGIDMSALSTQQSLANDRVLSGILNTGYNTALGTAEQQQGVGLGAAQANRAALAGAGQELAGIGQQAYGQGLGAAQAQEGLGQNVFNTGSTTATNLAGLGAGAQSAAISGGQAALAAGQVPQQTQQALDTAQYNQFLQQQSYPFQVDQFLANIAEGTGALSGSTTTTTQPGGLFSDARLKENIREVGKLKDGQKVYAYNYKGDNVTHIGMLAHEVEKHHPEAVGLAGGYKTVDYAKATAAARPKRAAGGGLGAANDPYDPQLMQEILANERAMFGQGAGGQGLAGGAPYGGSSRVPAPTTQPGHLQTAGALPQPKSGVDQMNSAARLGENAAKGLGAAEKLWNKYAPSQGAPTPDAPVAVDTSGLSRDLSTSPDFDASSLDTSVPEGLGGGFASGGGVDPYQDPGDKLDIPDENPDAKLATANGAPGGGGNAGQDAMKAIQTAAQVAAMFMNKGGRIHKDGGGGLDGGDDPSLVTDGLGDPAHDFWGNPVHGNSDFAATQAAGRKGLADASPPPAPPQPAPYHQSDADHFWFDTFPQTGAGRTIDAIKGAGKAGLHAVADGMSGAWDAASNFLTQPTDAHGRPLHQDPHPDPLVEADPRYASVQTDLFDGHHPQPHAASGLAGGQPPAAAAPAPAPHPHHSRPAVAAPPQTVDQRGYTPREQAGMDALVNSFGQDRPDVSQLTPEAVTPPPGQGGLGAAAPTPSLDAAPHLGVEGPMQRGLGAAENFGQGVLGTAGRLASGYGHALAEGDPATWAGLLSGVAAFGAAPTKHFGTALTQALGAGAEGYLGAQSQQAQLQGQEIKNQAGMSAMGPKGTVAQPVPPGTPGAFQGGDGRWYAYRVATPAMAGATGPTPPPRYLSPQGMQAAAPAVDDYWRPGEDQEGDAKRINDVTMAGGKAKQALTSLNGYASAVSANQTGPLQPGALMPLKQAVIGHLNDLARTLGLGPEMQINGLSDAQLFDKYSKIAAADRTAHNGQTSLGAYEDTLRATPNSAMERPAAIHMMSQLYVDNQKAADQAGAYTDLANAARSKRGVTAFSANTADRAIQDEFSQGRYQNEQASIERAIANGDWARTNALLGRMPNTPEGEAQKQKLYARFDQMYGPGMHRYFSGVQ